MSCIVEVVYVVKVVNIVGSLYTSRIDTSASVTDLISSGVGKWLSTSIETNFKASITKNSTAQYSSRWHAAHGACYYST